MIHVYNNSKLWWYETLIYYGKTMVLWKKLWYHTENNGTSIYEGKKNMVDYQNYDTLIYNGKKTMVVYQSNWT